MAGIYPELWLNRVDNRLRTGDMADWLDGIPEIASNVQQINVNGGVTEKNTIHIPYSDFLPDILYNYTDFPLPVQEYTDGTLDINLGKFMTKQIPISDDQAKGSSYSQIDNVTGLIVVALKIDKFARAAWNCSPAANTADTPVLVTTGRSGKYDAQGNEIILKSEDGLRYLLVYKDLVDLKTKFDKAQVPMVGRRLVLCTDHWNDLLLDTTRVGDLIRDAQKGTVVPNIAGFSIYQFINNPYYNGTNKLAYGSIPVAGQYQGSFAFYYLNIGVKTGFTYQYYLPANLNPSGQGNVLSYRHYHIAIPKRQQYYAAITSGVVA